jgi:PTH2 family peptidyl-tRNA hydrolase
LTRIGYEMTELKQVIVARTDLGMGKGKLAAQVAHASLGAADESMRGNREWYHQWKEQGQAKVVLKAGSESELRDLMKIAKTMGLPCALIQDAGLTQLEPGTATCLGIGPAPVSMIDKVTGQLKLL